MAQWRKVIVSGSDAVLESLTVGGGTGNSGVTISAAGALTVDGATDLNSTLNVDGTITGNTSLTLDATTISTSEIGVLDGAGTSVVASKAVIADGSRDVATIRNLTLDGTFTGATHVSSSGNVTASDAYLSGDLYVDGNGTFGGNLTFGDAATDSVSFGADIDSNLIPNTDDTYDLGSAAQAWQDLFLEGDITLTDAGSVKATAGNLTVDSEAATLVLDGHTGVDIDASNSGKVAIDGAGGIDIGVAADVAIDVDASTLDIDASGALTIDSATSISIGAAADKPIDIDATTFDVDASSALTMTSTTMAFDPSSTFDIDAAGAVTIDGSAITIGGDSDVAVDIDSSTLDIDASGAITIDGTGTVSIDGADDMNFSITSGTGGEDLTIAQIGANDSSILITAAGTGTDAVSIDATAGSMVIAPSLANGKTLTIGPSSATQMVFTPHGTAASEKISLINTAGTATDAIAVTATAGGVDIGAGTVLALDGASGINIGTAANVAVDFNTSTLDIDASSALTVTSTTVAFDPSSTFDIDAAGAVTIDGSAITIGGDNDNAAINIGYSTSEVTIGDNLTVTGDLTVNGDQTIISTTNLAIEDKFAVFASGSTSATDGGIIVSNTADGSGYALGYDVGTTRWVFDANLAVNATDIAPDAYVGVVQTGTTNPAIQDPAPTYGGTTNGIGTIYIDTNASHGDQIWIYA